MKRTRNSNIASTTSVEVGPVAVHSAMSVVGVALLSAFLSFPSCNKTFLPRISHETIENSYEVRGKTCEFTGKTFELSASFDFRTFHSFTAALSFWAAKTNALMILWETITHENSK